ncbi:2-C-methyl-D-erythritol 4-phosphate cytidylyltransferase [Planococcus lenghuensis]|uniref:2-C-methyl-D-erythritol 4-phosphate cytidylyltransferase n=1 Tax=Planococcus lenghuensis TaxID=2213202 RepID=A0A1Q2KVP1_9BACL|nr:2-C-methyl-D-erythritol 4-phosphate cytidylyltransferase [Planococcus lenghuensis]AQQ51742.1 2-C-methyl-D-erythritol 4-phosphate cytidylyltransferase [Planococcus lenghuensis]
MMYTAILPAAGSGTRMKANKNKLLLELGGKPVFIHTLEVFEADPACRSIWLAVKPEEQRIMEEEIKRFGLKKVYGLTGGGKERQDSVRACLEAIPACEVVLVHDAARPFIRQGTIRRLAETAAQEGAAIAAVKVKDTIKKAENGLVSETVDRDSLWMIQTPQAFRYSLLLEATRSANEDGFLGTDESMLTERLGYPVRIVESSYENIKITTPDDLIYGKAILEQRRQEEY